MKKQFLLISLLLLTGLTLSACGNQTFFDTTYTFNYAQIELPDGTVKTGEVKEWTDYTDGDQLQIKFEDGSTYLVHSSNAVLSVGKIQKVNNNGQ